MALPANVGYCSVTGRFIRAVLDGVDAGRDPDGIPVAGLQIVFTADLSPAIVRNPTSSPPVAIIIDPIVAATDVNGILVDSAGVAGITLVASDDPDLDPTGWTYTVTIQGPNLPKITTRFVAPAGGTIDLATVVPVPASPGATLLAWQTAAEQTIAARNEVVALLADLEAGGGGTGGTDVETVYDLIGSTLAAGPNISITVDDLNNLVTIGTSGLDKADVGLNLVDNTSDLSKPISTLTAAQLNLKAADSAVVHKTGAETIAGIKTFSSAPVVPDASFSTAKVSGLDTALGNKVDDDSEIALATLVDALGTTLGLISGRRLVEAIDNLVGYQVIRWISGAWSETPRASAKIRDFHSENDINATAPLGMQPWDSWYQHPDATI